MPPSSLPLFLPGQQIAVLLPFPLSGPYDYLIPESMTLCEGDFILVPFGKKETIGVVWGESNLSLPPDRCKTIKSKLDSPPLPKPLKSLIAWVSRYTMSPLGAVLKMAMSVPSALEPPRLKEKNSFTLESYHYNPAPLSPEQDQAAKKLRQTIDKGFSVSLLDGVTGSGKTEVYFSAIEKTLSLGKQILILLPEISLSSQWVNRFNERFGAFPILWHSAIGQARRRDSWRAISQGLGLVVAGARSALYLPFPNLGLIIVDEEHDASYKQEEGVLYNARDMAVVRAHLTDIPIILASATPSLESKINAQKGRYDLICLPHRHGGALLPDMSLIDLRKDPPPNRQQWLSPVLRDAIKETLEAGEQVLLFLNRRGYAPLTLCRQCGHRFQCPHCSAWLVEHRKNNRLQCHHCDYSIAMPSQCPSCESDHHFAACGPGVERVAEEVSKIFPDYRQALMTSDMFTSMSSATKLVEAMTNKEIDILIGTQIVTKGHHFPWLTLVGVVDADLGLAGGDLRASERTYQLLTQVSGRAGRAQHKGRVLLQTFQPEAQVLKALASGNVDAFYEQEAESREIMSMPPFGKLAALVISGRKAEAVELLARQIVRMAPPDPDITVLGPAPAPLFLLRGRHRFRLLIKATKSVNLQSYIRKVLEKHKLTSDLRIQIDIDPYSFM
jgi:primosomal protein N' (replication factor Y)